MNKKRIWLCTLLLNLACVVHGEAATGKPQQAFAEGFELIKAGKLAEAAAKFENGLKKEPDNALAHFYLGEAYLALKKIDKAMPHYQKAIELDPAGAAGRDARDRLSLLSRARKDLAAGSVFKDCDVCPEMVVIPAGQFIMGSPPNEAFRMSGEGPPRIVSIPAFAMGRTEITRAQFATFIGETGHDTGRECTGFNKAEKREAYNWANPGYKQGNTDPVVCVSWEDAHAYARWLSSKSGKSYRLPSESEWEYAARAGTLTATYWGNDRDQVCKYANVSDSTGKQAHPEMKLSANCSDGFAETAPVGSFKPNGYGLYDMLGNVSEWVEDCITPNYEGAPTDASPWIVDGCTRRVLRGGSWGSLFTITIRSAARFNAAEPSIRTIGIGLRISRSLP